MQAVLDSLAEHLRSRGKVNTRQLAKAIWLEPGGSRVFSKGAQRRWARGQKRWRLQTAELLLAVSLRKVLYLDNMGRGHQAGSVQGR